MEPYFTLSHRLPAQLSRLLHVPIFEDDADKTRIAANLYPIFLATVVGGIGYFLFLRPDSVGLIFMIGVGLIHFVFLGLLHYGRVYTTAYLFLFIMWLMFFASSFDGGGIQSTAFISGCFLIVFASGLLISWRTALIFMGIVVISGMGLLVLELSGNLPPVRAGITVVRAFLAIILNLMIGSGILFIANRSLENALSQSRTELAERKKAEAALRFSESQYRNLVSHMPNSAIILFDHDLRFVLVDGTELGHSGFTKEAVQGKKLHDAMPREFAELVEPNMRKVLAGEAFTADLPFGEDLWFTYNYVPLRNDQGEVALGMILAQNISKQRKLEEELQRYNQELENLVEERTAELRAAKDQIEVIIEHTRDGIALVNYDGDVQLANPAFDTLFNKNEVPSIERILWALVNDDDVESVADGLLDAIRYQRQKKIDTRVRSTDGAERDIDIDLVPVISNGNGNRKQSVVVSAHDITHLKEIERFKERFVANAVHDLSTPIAGLSTRLYLLQRDPKNLTEHVNSLKYQVDHLRNLLQDLRTLSQLDRGQLATHSRKIDFNAMVNRVFKTYESIAIENTQTLTADLLPDLPPLFCDESQVERVLVNLVSNAINYTPPGKSVTIKTAYDDPYIVFVVSDEGIGIPDHEKHQVFERFYRTDEARKHRNSGTGLGLAIVKEIVELHDGIIEVESRAAQGTTFTLKLPCLLR